MSDKISKLTKEQQDLFPLYRDEGIRVGLDTSRMDRDYVKTLIDRVYSEVLDKPSVPVFFVNGPNESYAKAKELGFSNSQSSLYSSSLYGSMDSNWVWTFKYYKEVLKLKNLNHVDLMIELARQVNIWTPFDNCCIVSEKPSVIRMNEGLLHCEDGPAIRYEDGFEVYAWQGQRVPKEWITDKESLKPETALTWPQIEQRRAAAEIIGWHNVLEQLPTKVLDKDEDETIGELLEVDIPEIGREWFLRVKCGTGRTFAIPVPKDQGFTTALEANAWTYGIDPDNFMPEVRT